MCRYGFARYKRHYACFECRKVFRRRLHEDILGGGEDRPFRCPQCAGEMLDMGFDFAAPRTSDARAWRLVRETLDAGITYHSCGCGVGERPRTRYELRQATED